MRLISQQHVNLVPAYARPGPLHEELDGVAGRDRSGETADLCAERATGSAKVGRTSRRSSSSPTTAVARSARTRKGRASSTEPPSASGGVYWDGESWRRVKLPTATTTPAHSEPSG